MAAPPQLATAVQANATTLRHLTLLFVDLSESTRLGSLLDAEAYNGMLQVLRSRWRAIVPRHGGVIARVQGDGALAIFGLPQAREGDARRAVEAALEMCSEASQLSFPSLSVPTGALQLHCGVHGGLVLIAEGDIERGRFDVSGDVPNLAAAICAQAPAGTVWISETCLGREAPAFRCDSALPIQAKGRREKLWVVPIAGFAPSADPLPADHWRGAAPFVGRSRELAALHTALADVIACGRARCIVISGGPGLGKSRLIEHFLNAVASDSVGVMSGISDDRISAEPFEPFMQMLRKADRIDVGDAALGAELDGLLTSSSRAMGNADGNVLTRWIQYLVAARPLVIALDDWQWTDDASRKLLDALEALPSRLLLVVGTRDESEQESGTTATRIRLEPLAEAEASQSIAHLLGNPDPLLVGDIHRYAGGNPLFIEELCNAAARANALALDPGRLEARGAWLQGLIEARVESLSLAAADALRAASVIGNVVPLSLLEAIRGVAIDAHVLRALVDSDFLLPTPAPNILRFKHVLTRDVVYSTVSMQQRQQWHLRLAAVLEVSESVGSDGAPEALAYHYDAGGVPTLAARYAEEAGDRALATPALDRARQHFLLALRALDGLTAWSDALKARWCGVTGKLGMVSVFDPLGLAGGVDLFVRAVALARQVGAPDLIARSEYWLGYVCYAKGLVAQSIVHLRAGLRTARGADDARLVAQLQVTLGQALHGACLYDEALPLLQAGVDTKRALSRVGGAMAVGSAYTLSCQGCLLGDRGQFEEAHVCLDQALALLGDTPHQVTASVRGWIATVLQWEGRWEAALAQSDEAGRVAERVKSRHLLAMCRALSGYSRWRLSGDADALDAVRSATRWIEARQGGFFMSLNYGWLADGCVQQGRIDEARRHAARLLQRARAGDVLGLALGSRAMARAAAGAGDCAAAARHMARARAAAERRDSAHERLANAATQAWIESLQGPATPGSHIRGMSGQSAAAMSWDTAAKPSRVGCSSLTQWSL